MSVEMNRVIARLAVLVALMIVVTSAAACAADSGTNRVIFDAEEILDESTLETKTLRDWHVEEKTAEEGKASLVGIVSMLVGLIPANSPDRHV